MAQSESAYRFEQFEGYSVVALFPQLNDSQWADIDRVGTELVAKLQNVENPRFIVDLSGLKYMGSAMVALIVRLWKSVKDSKKGKMVVVNQNDMVFEVLKLAGLHNVWTIVESRDDAVRALGLNPRSTAGLPGDSGVGAMLWTVAGVVSVVGAAIGLVLLLSPVTIVGEHTAQVIVVLFAALGLIVGMISAVKETDWRQKVGIGVVVASLILVLAGILTAPGGHPAKADAEAATGAGPEQAANAAPPAGSAQGR